MYLINNEPQLFESRSMVMCKEHLTWFSSS